MPSQLTASDLNALFHDCFARNREPGCSVAVIGAEADLSVIDIRVTFLAGRTYCCAEPGCHFSLPGLRKVAAKHGMALPDRLRVRFYGFVEEGAIFQNLKMTNGSQRVEAYGYECEFTDE